MLNIFEGFKFVTSADDAAKRNFQVSFNKLQII